MMKASICLSVEIGEFGTAMQITNMHGICIQRAIIQVIYRIRASHQGSTPYKVNILCSVNGACFLRTLRSINFTNV